ncbi:MAG: 1-acyl-sn-glycerol-3-phosphate acyltransferase [Actinomycetales bacterium]|nr:1-acyl-sn-glycerol-3-phosphate acyltransferase [Actinomycetales bacterium]
MAEDTELILNPDKTPLYRVVAAILTVLSWLLFRPRVRGSENIPRTGPVLIAPVHRSNVDFVFTLFISPRKVFFMAKQELFGVPVLGTLLRHVGAFPVDRSTADRESLRLAEEVLRRGEALILFPEGTRREGRRIDELHDGAMFIASRSGAATVPVGIAGSDRAMPSHAKLPHFARVRVVVGEPIAPPSAEGRVPRSLIAAKTEELREQLEAVYHQALDER